MRTPSRRRRGRGGQGGHDPRARIRTRELRVMELTVVGWSQHQIAADLGVEPGGGVQDPEARRTARAA